MDTSHYPKEDFPKGWSITDLDSICTTINGLWKGEKGPLVNIGVIRNANFTKEFTLDYSKIEYIDVELRSFERRYLDDGDIIVEKSGGSDNFPVGRSILFCGESRKYSFSNFTMSLRIIDKRSVLPKYLYYVLQQKYRRGDMRQMQTQTTGLHNLLSDVFLSMPIPIPPKEEQQRIVERVDNIFKIVSELDVLRHESTHLIDAAKSRILDLAIHGKLVPQDSSDEPAIEILKRINPAFTPSDNLHYNGVVPKGWLLLTYNDVADYINGRAFKPEEWESNGVPIIRIQNLNEPCAPYNYSSGSFERQYNVQEGDLLFAWAASLGVYIWKGQDAWLNQHIFKVTPYSCIDKEYLYFALSASINDFYQKCHGSGMVHITRKLFINMPLLLPPMNEQKRIIKAIKAYYDILDNIVAGLN